VIDDGAGFTAAPEKVAGTGLRIMRYRADLIGAQLDISSARPQGTIVSCSVAQHPAAERGSLVNGQQSCPV
jgi:signal transduction histidine kinase